MAITGTPERPYAAWTRRTGDREAESHSGLHRHRRTRCSWRSDWNGKIQWDDEDHSAWFYFYRDQMREWIFYTDLHTFKDRYELVQRERTPGLLLLGAWRRRPGDLDLPPEATTIGGGSQTSATGKP